MPDQTDHDALDTRIRALVARAVADAPAPPELDLADIPVGDPRPDRRAWWLGGGVAALAAAALVTAFVLVGDTDESVTTPATDPTTAPTPTPAPSTTPAPTTSLAPEVSTTTSTIVATPAAPSTLTAGPEGVVEHSDGEVRTLTSEPAAIALDAGDGRVIVQLTSTETSDVFDTAPRLLAPDGSLTELFGTVDWDGTVVLHDIEVVDGRRLLLFSLQGPAVPQEPNESLYVVDLDLDTPERTLVAENIGGWEFGTQRLHLATTGLIVGQASSESNHSIFIVAVPGSPATAAALPTAADLGLETSYGDCNDCPYAFTVSPDGRSVLWIDGAAQRLVLRSLDPPSSETVPLAAVPGGYVTDVDVDPASDSAVLSFGGEPNPAPVTLPLDGSAPTTLEGVTATQSPLGGGSISGQVVTPSTTTTTPAAPAGVMLATAGPEGVTVIENGVEIRRLAQPAVIALLTPGGAVIFQPAPTTPDGTPGDPLIWRPDDDTVEALLGPLGERQSYRLHDLAVVAGVPTLLYGVATIGPGDPRTNYSEYVAQTTEVVHALTMTPGDWTTAQIAEMNTWEAGFSRLSLSNGGTIIGTVYDQTEQRFFGAVVPGSPDDGEGDPADPAALGVEPSYSECDSSCPNRFTISADGESIVWTEGSELVVFDTTSGGKRAWTVPSLAGELFRSLDVRTSSDGGVEAAISFPLGGGSPVVAATSPPGDVVESEVAGRVVTFGP